MSSSFCIQNGKMKFECTLNAASVSSNHASRFCERIPGDGENSKLFALAKLAFYFKIYYFVFSRWVRSLNKITWTDLLSFIMSSSSWMVPPM